MESPQVRLVIAISLDGRIAFAQGGKSNLGGKGDRSVLEKALTWCDASLMGRKTLSVHQSTCLIHNSEFKKQRNREGRPDQPLSLIVSQKACFSKKLKYFKQPLTRWLLTPNRKLSVQPDLFDRHFFMKETWSETLFDLCDEGYSKIVLLGGIKLLNSLLLEDKIDQLQLTFIPRILAGQYTWIPPQMKNLPIELTQSKAWKLENMKNLGDSEVMLKYLRNRS